MEFSKKLNANTNNVKNKILLSAIIVIILVAYVAFALGRPFPKLTGTKDEIKVNLPKIPTIIWPEYGQASVGGKDFGLLATNGEQTSHAIASIAKTVLALAVLEQKPLGAGQQGPTITIKEKDVNYYKEFLAQNGSIVPVNVGEKLTQYQAFQALLLPSGDNIADTLADWAFGSVDNYLSYANKMVTKWGLKQTHMGDASGLSPQTVSSAKDLVTIAEKVMDEPVLAEIVGQSNATLPVAGAVKNYDTILGQNGVIGIKTGNTEEAGGCFMFAAKQMVDGKEVMLIGAILGASSRGVALNDTKKLIENNSNSWRFIDAVKSNQVVGSYELPWGRSVKVVAKDNLPILAARQTKVKVSVKFDEVNKPTEKGTKVGDIIVEANGKSFTTPAILNGEIANPSVLWKLTHP